MVIRLTKNLLVNSSFGEMILFACKGKVGAFDPKVRGTDR